MTRLYAACIVGVPLLWLLVRATRSVRGRQLLFLVASYLFYLSFGWRFFAILVAGTLFNFAWGGAIRRQPTTGRLWIGIVANVSLLSVFKYLPTAAAPFADSSALASSVAHLALPIGISFWTFQGLSYLFDQYRQENLDPTLIEFMLYMGFAPTVLSGPICRLPELLPQFRENVSPSWKDVSAGARSIWIGLLMIAVARLFGSGLSGQGINWGFDQTAAGLSTSDAWLLLVGYGFELFFDFAGYSRVVIGLAGMFGILLPENFRRPFLSPTPSVFWTRWHMTLSFWIRDYLFMPLATMRREIWWRNTMLVASMVVFGLWHKASVLFLLWGTYQGLLLLAHRLIQQWQRRKRVQLSGRMWTSLSWLITFTAITLGWIMFRAQDWAQAGSLFRATLMPSFSHPALLPTDLYVLIIGVAVAYFVLARLEERLEPDRGVLTAIPLELRYLCYAGIAYFTLFRSAEPQSFIYFQF